MRQTLDLLVLIVFFSTAVPQTTRLLRTSNKALIMKAIVFLLLPWVTETTWICLQFFIGSITIIYWYSTDEGFKSKTFLMFYQKCLYEKNLEIYFELLFKTTTIRVLYFCPGRIKNTFSRKSIFYFCTFWNMKGLVGSLVLSYGGLNFQDASS